jgi:hypothetical protein
MMRFTAQGFTRARRTVTDDHVQQLYASPYRERLVQSEGEYHTVKTKHAGPRDSSDWPLELLWSPSNMQPFDLHRPLRQE